MNRTAPNFARPLRLAALVLPVVAVACGHHPTAPAKLSGPFLGQLPPGGEPKVFAPGFVATGLETRDVAMTPDGTELYFSVSVGGKTMIMVTRQVGGAWTEPEVAPFSDVGLNIEPCIAPDGSRLMFLSTRPPAGEEAKPGWTHQNIWAVDRQADGWGEPYDLGPPINTTSGEYFPSLTRDGTLYFTREDAPRQSSIYRARWVDGHYQEPERLGPEVNCGSNRFNAFVAPDESFVIVPAVGVEEDPGQVAYYVVFRNRDDSWSEPVNMGEQVNRPGTRGWSASLSPDARYLFFMTNRPDTGLLAPRPGTTLGELLDLAVRPGNGSADIYWVDAAILDALRPS